MQQFHPHPYQQAGIEAILEKPGVALWMEMGLGKTVVTLTAIDQLIYDRLEISRVLIIAPKKVAEATWQDEAAKWEHLQHLRISTVLGTEKQRKAALEAPADIYIINRENVPCWFTHWAGAGTLTWWFWTRHPASRTTLPSGSKPSRRCGLASTKWSS